MIKYHVKFTHQLPQLYQLQQRDTPTQYITETVDAEWELDAWVDVFTYIYTHYNVIGDVEVTQKYQAVSELERGN
jgi:hypothetical protein